LQSITNNQVVAVSHILGSVQMS